MCTVCDSVDQFEAGGFCSALLGVDCISCKGMFNEYLTRTTAVCAYDVVQLLRLRPVTTTPPDWMRYAVALISSELVVLFGS